MTRGLVQPATGRAIVIDTVNGVLITMTPERNYMVSGFLLFWLVAWGLGGAVTAYGFVASGFLARTALFLLFWVLSLFFAVRILVQVTWGQETLSITASSLTVGYRNRWFSKVKTYALKDVTRLRILEPDIVDSPFGKRRRKLLNPAGTLRFDHGMQSVTFAGGIDEPEARHLLDSLRAKGLITEANLA